MLNADALTKSNVNLLDNLKYFLYCCCPTVISNQLYPRQLRFRKDIIMQSYDVLTKRNNDALSLMDSFIEKLKQSSVSVHDEETSTMHAKIVDKWTIERFILEKNSNRVNIYDK